MKGLLLPNLDVHLSLQAPSKGCSKNPRKKESPMNRIFLQVCLTEELKQVCLKRQLRQDSRVQWHPQAALVTQGHTLHTAQDRDWVTSMCCCSLQGTSLCISNTVWHQVSSQSTSYTFLSICSLQAIPFIPYQMWDPLQDHLGKQQEANMQVGKVPVLICASLLGGACLFFWSTCCEYKNRQNKIFQVVSIVMDTLPALPLC